MANIVEKKTLIEYLQKQEGEYAVIGSVYGIEFDPKGKKDTEAHYHFPHNAFDKSDVRLIGTIMAIVICPKKSLSKEIQERIDNMQDIED